MCGTPPLSPASTPDSPTRRTPPASRISSAFIRLHSCGAVIVHRQLVIFCTYPPPRLQARHVPGVPCDGEICHEDVADGERSPALAGVHAQRPGGLQRVVHDDGHGHAAKYGRHLGCPPPLPRLGRRARQRAPRRISRPMRVSVCMCGSFGQRFWIRAPRCGPCHTAQRARKRPNLPKTVPIYATKPPGTTLPNSSRRPGAAEAAEEVSALGGSRTHTFGIC